MDDSDLDPVHPPRKSSIGALVLPLRRRPRRGVRTRREPSWRPRRRATANHVWVAGLEADRVYSYRVLVNGREFAGGAAAGLARSAPIPASRVSSSRAGATTIGSAPIRARNRTPTRPSRSSATSAPASGSARRKDGASARSQRRSRGSVDREGVRLLLTTGDNIYAGRSLLGIPLGSTGDEDDDWFFTFFQPYRYLINRIPGLSRASAITTATRPRSTTTATRSWTTSTWRSAC